MEKNVRKKKKTQRKKSAQSGEFAAARGCGSLCRYYKRPESLIDEDSIVPMEKKNKKFCA